MYVKKILQLSRRREAQLQHVREAMREWSLKICRNRKTDETCFVGEVASKKGNRVSVLQRVGDHVGFNLAGSIQPEVDYSTLKLYATTSRAMNRRRKYLLRGTLQHSLNVGGKEG